MKKWFIFALCFILFTSFVGCSDSSGKLNTPVSTGKTTPTEKNELSMPTNGNATTTEKPDSTDENDTTTTEVPVSTESVDETTNGNLIPTQIAGDNTIQPSATAMPTAKPVATSNPIVSTKPTGTSNMATATKKPTSTAKSTATAKPTATSKPSATVTSKPTATQKPSPTPTTKVVTYSFYPSNITVYSGDSTPVYFKIKDSNGKNISASELDLYWYDIGNGDLNYNRNTAQQNGTYSVSDANVSRLSAMIYSNGSEELSVSGYWGKIGTTTIKCKHKSGQILTLTVKSIKDPKYAAYYHPYNWSVIDADMKAFVESKNGVYDTTMTPENSGYFPGSNVGGYTSQGKGLYESFINKFISTEKSFIESNPHDGNTLDNWNGARHYLWRQLISGTAGTDSEYYLVRDLYG